MMLAAAVLSAAALLRNGDFAAAGQAYQLEYRQNHADANALFALTELALFDNRVGDARRWLDLARGAAPSDPRLAQYGDLLEMRSDPQIDRIGPSSSDAVLAFVQSDPLPMVAVTVDGRQAWFLIDTGAPNVVLDSRFAKAIGVKAMGEHQGTFAGGQHAPVMQATVARLDLGPLSLSNVPASVLPVGDLMGAGHTVDGILGTALFARFLTTLDYRSGQLILRDPSESAAFEARARASGATIVPMWLAGDHFVFVRARAGDGPEGLFNVDTGGTFGVQLTKDAIDAARITLDTDDTRTGMGGAGPTSFIPFTTGVTVGSLTRTSLAGIYTPQGNQYGIFPFDVTGTISRDFFRNTALTFDFRTMQLVIEPA